MKLKKFLILSCLVFFCAGAAYSQIEDLAEDKHKAADSKSESEKDKDVSFAIHGYAQANFVLSRNDFGSRGNAWLNSRYEFPRAGGTLQLELEGNAYDIAHFFSAVMIEYNAAGEKTNFPTYYFPTLMFPGGYQLLNYYTPNAAFKKSEISKAPTVNVRETYVDLYGKGVTFRVGQQIISWGEIEGIEAPSDVVIPWDFTTMSNYFEYSRIGVTAANLSFHFAKQQLQFIWMPLFQPNKLPMESLYKRGVSSIKRPTFEARNGEYAARLSGVLGDQFRYGLGFVYGFDDMPDANVKMFVETAPFGLPMQLTEMTYNRTLMPTLDMGIGVGQVLTWKVSANASLTRNFWNKKNTTKIFAMPGSTLIEYDAETIKKSTVTFLTGPESTNLFAKIYVGFYLGQQWVLKYSKPSSLSLSKQIVEGYGQQNQYKWMLSSNIQRSFLAGDVLDVQIRFALYTDPKLKKWDYVVYPYLMYKFTNGVSTALGFVFAHRLGDVRNMVISETRYSF